TWVHVVDPATDRRQPTDSPPRSGAERADPAVEDNVGALAGAFAGEELLLVDRPPAPVLGHAVAPTLEPTRHPQVVGHLHPGQNRDQGGVRAGARADALEHE